MQGLFVPFARVGSGDPVRVLRLFHNKYSGYCCIHLLCKATYNLSLPRLSANYYGLPTTVQLRAAHESRCSLFGVSRSTAQVLYCTCLNGTFLGPFTTSRQYYIHTKPLSFIQVYDKRFYFLSQIRKVAYFVHMGHFRIMKDFSCSSI